MRALDRLNARASLVAALHGDLRRQDIGGSVETALSNSMTSLGVMPSLFGLGERAPHTLLSSPSFSTNHLHNDQTPLIASEVLRRSNPQYSSNFFVDPPITIRESQSLAEMRLCRAAILSPHSTFSGVPPLDPYQSATFASGNTSLGRTSSLTSTVSPVRADAVGMFSNDGIPRPVPSTTCAVPPVNPLPLSDIPPVSLPAMPNFPSHLTSAKRKRKSGRAPRPKKPKDCPRRPLSAYNIFFKEERAKILASIPSPDQATSNCFNELNDETEVDSSKTTVPKKPHGKIDFASLGKIIGWRWQHSSPSTVEYYKQLAKEDMKRYRSEMEEYRIAKASKKISNSSQGKEQTQSSEINPSADSEDVPDESTDQSEKKQKLIQSDSDENVQVA